MVVELLKCSTQIHCHRLLTASIYGLANDNSLVASVADDRVTFRSKDRRLQGRVADVRGNIILENSLTTGADIVEQDLSKFRRTI